MSLVKMHNKKLGITYVYESRSYWDKEKKQPRNERKLIGKLDPVTGELIPTGKPGRWGAKSKDTIAPEAKAQMDPDVFNAAIADKDRRISELELKIVTLENRCRQKDEIISRIRSVIDSSKGGQ